MLVFKDSEIVQQTSPLVGAPLAKTMFRLAVPGVIGALLFSAVGLAEAQFLKEAGVEAIAAVALVFPLTMLAAMLSAGAIGGAVSGLTARAIGAGDFQKASSVLVCAVIISVVGGLLMWWLVHQYGFLLYEYASDNQSVNAAAQRYAGLVFPAIIVFWLVNMLSSVLRGTGDMVRPALIATVLLGSYILFAMLLIPRAGELDASVSAAAVAMVAAYIVSLLAAIYFILHKEQPVRFQWSAFSWQTLKQILKQGLLAGSQSVMTIAYALITTLLFSRFGTDWLAGFGLAVRLELIMVPIIFGVGASLIAIVGAYVGAGQRERAISIAWRGILINAALVGGIGILLALFPGVWCNLVGSDATVNGYCAQSVRTIAPTYAFFALGLGGYFASQGLDTLKVPVVGALLRLLVVTSGLLWVSDQIPVEWALYLVAGAVVVYGLFVMFGLKYGAWRQLDSD